MTPNLLNKSKQLADDQEEDPSSFYKNLETHEYAEIIEKIRNFAEKGLQGDETLMESALFNILGECQDSLIRLGFSSSLQKKINQKPLELLQAASKPQRK